MDYILDTKDITMEFSGVKVLDRINMKVQKGNIHAIVGENGAGKSTLMKILSGVYQPTSGTLFYDGKHVKFDIPKDAKKAGINIIHQEFSLVPYLNAVENIFLGNEIKSNGILSKGLMRIKASELLGRLNADIDLRVPVSELSVANQQYVEIAKAISTETKLLIFDEPTASLTGKEIENLFELINNIKKQGVTILYISHHLDEIFQIADQFSCLRDGILVGTKNVKETTKQEMVKMMVGREINQAFPDKPLKIDNEVILGVKGLSNEHVTDISFELKKGEILGIAGLVGSGRTETIRALIGADKKHQGEITIKGNITKINSPAHALKNGIGLIPESRKTQGLVLDATIKNNITIAILDKLIGKIPIISQKNEKEIVKKSISDLSIKASSMNQNVRKLSGGNQQKVVLAKWINTDTEILIFDEPTRGIDIGAKEEIYKLLRKLTKQGLSIIMISSELPEVIGMSDRVLVMYKGKIAAEIDGSEATQEKIMYYGTGGDNYETEHIN